MIIKGMKDWKRDFTEDFTVGDRVDEEIYNEFLNVLPPLTNTNTMLQVSEPYGYHKNGVTYMTFTNDGISWIYKGICTRGSDIHRG